MCIFTLAGSNSSVSDESQRSVLVAVLTGLLPTQQLAHRARHSVCPETRVTGSPRHRAASRLSGCLVERT